MNEKYVSAAVFISVIAVGAGVAYYLYPTAIDNAVGIGSAQPGAVADADLLALDDGSSSLPSASDSGIDAAAALPALTSSAASAKKAAQKNNGAAKNGAAAVRADASQGLVITSPPVQDKSYTSDDGNANNTFNNTAALSLLRCYHRRPLRHRHVFAPWQCTGDDHATVIFNEIAWMGRRATGEWMEIKNISANDVDLSGWELLNASGKIKISFADGDAAVPGGSLSLARRRWCG